jgi:glycerol-1-phosphate dehydrogenase [NAD(P)+]
MQIWNVPIINILPFTQIEETRSVALVHTQPAYEIVKNKLDLSIVWQAEVFEATQTHWDLLDRELDAEVIYSVGGGLSVDAAKYLASKHNLPLVCLPTALTVDAFFTWASGIRKRGCVHYIETKPPDLIIVDYDILTAAPKHLRAAAICDVLSIATGSWDWKFAEERGKNPPEMIFNPFAYQTAQAILAGAIDCAEAAGNGDIAGIKQLIDCLILEVQLCNQIGHARPEEGSEHYFAYAVENEMGKGLPHGDLVGPGILLMAERQGQDTALLKNALQACCIPLENIPADVIEKTLKILPTYCQEHELPFGIAHTI